MQIAGIVGGARKVVRVLARVKPGEKVVIVADTDTMTVAEALAVASLDITPEVVTTVMNPVAVDGDEPPAIVAAAMLAADVALLPVSYSISHSTATRKALGERDAGALVAGDHTGPTRARRRGGGFRGGLAEGPEDGRVAG